jgi:hypothetical protein
MIVVKVKATSHSSDLKISINSSDSLRVLKERVKTELHCQDKFLRLISSGRLLEPDSASLSKLGIVDGSFVHAVVSSQEPRHPSGVSGGNSVNQASAGRSAVSTPAPREYHGLDRLVETGGLTIDETAALRSSFQQQIEEFSQGHPRRADEDENAYRYRIEELWMREQGPNSEFTLNLPRSRTNFSSMGLSVPSFQAIRSMAELTLDDEAHSSSGTFREFLWGVLLGVSLGFLMIFCVWDRNISAKQKLGLMVGISIHMLTGYFQNTTTIAPSHSATHSVHDVDNSVNKGENSNEPVEISLDIPVN